MSKTCNSTFSFKIAAIVSGKYGDLSFVLKPNHLFKRLMVQNIKTPDQLAVIAFCLIFVSRSSSVIQGLAVLSALTGSKTPPQNSAEAKKLGGNQLSVKARLVQLIIRGDEQNPTD